MVYGIAVTGTQLGKIVGYDSRYVEAWVSVVRRTGGTKARPDGFKR